LNREVLAILKTSSTSVDWFFSFETIKSPGVNL